MATIVNASAAEDTAAGAQTAERGAATADQVANTTGDATAASTRAGQAADACSFTGSTLVLMADGSHKPIGQIDAGDTVTATDPGDGASSAQSVTAVWPHTDQIWDLLLSDGTTIHTTANHPWWDSTTRTWTRTDHLADGDQLSTANGQTATIESVTPTTQTDTTYNLTVTGPHTYHVGDDSLLVHNCGGNVDPSTPIGHTGTRPANVVAPGTNQPGTVNGLDYTGHAFDQMQARGVMPSVVEDAIATRITSPGRGGATVFYSAENNVKAVVNPSGKVITVYGG